MLVRADKDGAEKLGIGAADGTAPGNIAEAAAAAVDAREFAVKLAAGFTPEFKELEAAFALLLVGEVPPLDPVVALPDAGTNPCNNV